jgi:hypothetical protein
MLEEAFPALKMIHEEDIKPEVNGTGNGTTANEGLEGDMEAEGDE